MRLAFKLAAALIVGIALVMVANTLVRVRREVELFQRDQERDQRVMGWTLRNAVEAVWKTDGEAHARAVLAAIEVGDLELRWRWLDEVQADPELADTAAPLRAGREVVRVRRGVDGDHRYTLVPMAPEHLRPAVLELSETASPPRAFIRASILENVFATTSIVAMCSVIALTLGYWFVGRPMRLLTAKARRVGSGDFSGPLALRQRDEIGALAAEIDATSERLAEAQRRVAAETEGRIRAYEQLRHADRLKTIGQLASGVAHELGTPLNVVSGHAGMIISDPTPEVSAAGARTIVQQTERMARIIRKLLDFSRRGASRLARHELGRIVADAVEILAPLARERRVTVAVVAADAVVAAVDPDQLLQALTNLMVNGMQAMSGGGRLTIIVDRRRARPPAGHAAEAGELACVTVADEGAGMDQETLAHVFEPFFTTKGVGEGTGLGLSVAWGIVEEHGGWIEARSRPGAGSEFSVFLRDEAP